MAVVGSSPRRPDGIAKLRGTAGYVDDLIDGDCWHGATVRSPVVCGRLSRIDTRDALEADPDVVVVSAADLPGANELPVIERDWPVLAADRIEHLNQPIALVAAPTRERARAAAARITAGIEPERPILTLDDGNDVLASCAIDHGDVAEAFARAAQRDDAVIVEGTYATGLQEHAYIETQGMLARRTANEIIVTGSLQCPYYLQHALEHVFAGTPLTPRVVQATTGGGFGGKEEFPDLIGAHAALLSWKAGRDVALLYDRHEDIVGTTKRHPARITHRTAVSTTGELIAQDVDITLDGGAFVTLSPVVLSRALIHAAGPYRCPHVRIRGRALKTNTPPNGAFRGFGAPQSQFACERQMDAIGRRLGLDPFTLRARNAYVPGDVTPTGQVLDASTSALDVLRKAADETNFVARWKANQDAARTAPGDDAVRPGLGLALAWHGSGFTGDGERRLGARAAVELREDGRVVVLSGSTDFGQGTEIAFRQIVADAVGITIDDVLVERPDTARVPDSGPTVASRTVMIVGGLLDAAARELAARIDGTGPFVDRAARWYARHGSTRIERAHVTPPGATFDESTYRGTAYPTYGWICDVVEIDFDRDTLETRPAKVTIACDVGRAVHRTSCVGQIEGGTLQAVAWGYLEEVKVEAGRYLNDRLQTCMIPTTRDAPEMVVHLIENPTPANALGTKGVGEIPTDAGAPAVVAAIENASGIVANAIPATPERLLDLRSGEATP